MRRGNHDPENPYKVLDLGQMYFLALISRDPKYPNRPVHFHGLNRHQKPSGQLNIRDSQFREIL
jgi:hypothetical protein